MEQTSLGEDVITFCSGIGIADVAECGNDDVYGSGAGSGSMSSGGFAYGSGSGAGGGSQAGSAYGSGSGAGGGAMWSTAYGAGSGSGGVAGECFFLLRCLFQSPPRVSREDMFFPTGFLLIDLLKAGTQARR